MEEARFLLPIQGRPIGFVTATRLERPKNFPVYPVDSPQGNFFQRDATSSATPESFAYSSSAKRKEAAATFCSRCSMEEVPGIGSMTGDRRRSQASAMCVGV